MKWTKKDWLGREQVWYSKDVIDRIYKIAKESNYIDDRDAIADILEIIENENTEN